MANMLSVSTFLMISLAIMIATPASSVVPRIKTSHTSITIDKGKYDMVEFTLDEPIICNNMDSSCIVTVLLTNPNPKKNKFG